MPMYFDFIAGCFGGAAGVFVGHPLDTVKVRLQTQAPGQYRGTIHCFASIVRKEGIPGLFKGLSSPLASLTAINAVVFGVYGNIVKQCEDKESIRTHFIAGCASGFAQSPIAGPTEILKLRMQIQGELAKKLYHSSFDCMCKIVRQNGVKTLFRGLTATVLRDIPSFGVYFATYEYLVKKFSKDGTINTVTTLELLTAGGIAGMMSWVFNYPIDVVKTNFQAHDHYKSYFEVVRQTYKTQGYRGFFNGFNSTLIRAFPTNAATFFAVEWSYRILVELKKFYTHQSNTEPQSKISPAGPSHYFHDNHCFLLAEAGSTYIDPTIHGSRFM